MLVSMIQDVKMVVLCVCPTDPLLFTCIVSDSPIVDITVTFPSGDEIDLTVENMITGDLPDGVHVKSHNVTIDGTFNYVLTLSIESASLLNGGEIRCDTNAIDNDDIARCPVAGKPVCCSNMSQYNFTHILVCELFTSHR